MMPRITLLLGDRNGIGPELNARLLADERSYERAVIEVLGDPAVLDEGIQVAGLPIDRSRFTVVAFRPVPTIETTPGQATKSAGEEMLALLAHSTKRVLSGEADGVVFAPLNKEAMHLGGLRHEDEMRYLTEVLAYDGVVGELNVFDKLWTTRVTSHIPLKDVADHVTIDGILDATRFAHETLLRAGFENPRIGVAALNPHAGDGGNFGTEEIDVIAPAVARAKAEGIDAAGPYPSDTVFVRARDGAFDVVVTMYHDQGQIAMKLMGFAQGVTVLGGLPMPVTTCGHGTGYDIVGKGMAGPGSIINAFNICCDMATSSVERTTA